MCGACHHENPTRRNNNEHKCHKQKSFESGSRVALQDNHVTSLDIIGLNWKTTLVTHYFGTLEAPQHIYIQQNHPKRNKCSNSNFDMTCQELTYLTMSATYVFTPPAKSRFKGAVTNIKGTPQQLWSKSERGLDEDLYHCTWNSKND